MTIKNPALIPPRVDFFDERTGKISREWYLYLLNLANLTIDSGNANDLAVEVAFSNDNTSQISELTKIVERIDTDTTDPFSVTGTVRYVNATAPDGVLSVGGVPYQNNGVITHAWAGTSGGVPYFSGPTSMLSSGVLGATQVVLGGGAGAAPNTSANLTFNGTTLVVTGGGTFSGNVGIGELSPTRKLVIREDSSGGPTIGAMYNADVTNGNASNWSFRTDTTGVGATAFSELAVVQGRFNQHDHATRSGSIRFIGTSAGVFKDFIFGGAGDIALNATNKVYLDGVTQNTNATFTGDTYITESSANVFDIVVGGTNTIRSSATAITLTGTASVSGVFSANTIGVLSGTTATVYNTTATTVNAFGAATTLNVGATTGTMTVANTTLAAKAITASTTLAVTGNTTLSSKIDAGGGGSVDYIYNIFRANFTSGGASTVAAGTLFNGTLTGASGDTGYLVGTAFNPGGIVTQNASNTIGVVASVYIGEPNITKGATDTITRASTLHIVSAPTEGVSNSAISVASGSTDVQALTATAITASTTITATGTIRAGGFTVATLPANAAGLIAYVTDQLTAPAAKGVAPTGGGAVTCYVMNTGAGWVGI